MWWIWGENESLLIRLWSRNWEWKKQQKRECKTETAKWRTHQEDPKRLTIVDAVDTEDWMLEMYTNDVNY